MINRLKPKSEFSRNVLTLMTGTTIAQAIPIAISPILTRLYTPEDFGVFALFIAITTIFGSIANGRYELAIMIPKKDEDAINIFALGFIITVFISFLLLAIVVLFNDYFTKLLNNEEIRIWLYFVPLTTFLMGLWNILNYFNNRKKQYKDIANATIVKSLITAITQLSIGFIKQGATGLVSGQILSQFFANAKLLNNIVKNRKLLSKISKIKIIALGKRYKKFPKFDMPSAIMNTASIQVPILLLGSLFSTSTVGFFSLSHKFISMPMSIIGGSIGQVFFQKSVEVKNNKEALKNLTLNTYKKLFKLGIIPFSIITAFGDYIFAFAFGSNWVIAGEYAQVLSIWILFVFITSPLSTLYLTLEKQKEGLIFNISIFISRIVVIIFGSLFFDDAYITILLYGCTGTIFWMFWSLYLLKLASINIFAVFLYTIKYILLFMGGLLLLRSFI